jgi:alkylhydroperoxidase family enzyme
VEPAKLLALKKDDAVLSPRERAAVTFARKLTGTPGRMRKEDVAALQAGLGSEHEAMDALLQTCAFNFMNRFTDGLRLPSEDESIRVYEEVYGTGAYRAFPRGTPGSGAARR